MNQKRIFFIGLTLFSLMLLSACATSKAPVFDGWKQKSAATSTYRVQARDTIYSVAWAFAMDYRELAKINNIPEPYTLSPGQKLQMSAPRQRNNNDTHQALLAAAATPIAQTVEAPIAADATTVSVSNTHPSNTSTTAKAPQTTPASSVSATLSPAKLDETAKIAKTPTGWLWPTKGKVVQGFSSASGGNKGLDIAGQLNQPVVATTSGKVVYTGASLPGYGNLIILKHGESELSAYAFNKVIEVKEGQVVRAGQTIARMGKNDDGKAMLHFEIRKGGKPTDPMPYLSGKVLALQSPH
jgi:lipoprotein NlpD